MTMITPSYLGETIEYSSLHACRSTLEDPTHSHWSGYAKASTPNGRLRRAAQRATRRPSLHRVNRDSLRHVRVESRCGAVLLLLAAGVEPGCTRILRTRFPQENDGWHTKTS